MIKMGLITIALVALCVVGILGFQGMKREAAPWQWINDMDQQQKIKAQAPSAIFPDGRGSRMPVPGTVPLGVPVGQEYLMTGAMGGMWGDGIPFEVTPQFMRHGQERYTIHCAVCHGAAGNGAGVASKYGWGAITNLHGEKYRVMADGEIYNTVAYGKGTMMGYGANLTLEDRWAIVAYVRALQRSQRAEKSDLSQADQQKLVKQP